MKKLLFLLFVSYNICSNTFAQVIVSYVQKNPYEFKLNAVSEFSLINAGSTLKVNVKVELLQGQKQIYSCNYLNLSCNNGNNNYPSIQPSNETKNNSIVGLTTNGSLPSGQYELCFTVIDEIKQEELAQTCFDISVKSLSPPFLIYPNDGSIINILNPNLIWSPPLGSNTFEKYKYDLKLVEIQNNQQPIDAINQNFAILKLQELNSTQLLYPFNAAKLVNGKSYSWQVIAKNDNGYHAETEVWTFTVKLDSLSEEKVVFFENHVIPKSELDGSFINIKNELRLDLSPFDVSMINYQILDNNKNVIIDNEENIVKQLGNNKYILDLNYSEKLKSNTLYVAKIVGRKGEKGYVMFKYYKK